jgi:Serine/threonine protein kinase
MNLPDGYFLQGEKYQLTNTIGQGGFGITYLGVWNTEVKGELGAMKTKVPVCIKEYFFKDYCYRNKDSFTVNVHSETGEKLFGKFKEKLIKEANILSAVHHPYIVNVLEVFEENNTAYIVMEYIKGCSLKYMLDKEGVLSENKVLKYIHQIGNALNFVHEKSIVHLDIKPGNILIDKEDNARLIDFGVSKRYDIEEQETSTTTLTLSKGFASIEQYDDEGTQNFSPCPDIYSLGATMYNLLTGVIPVESILRATKKMLPPSSYNSNVSAKTESAIIKAMEIKPEDRFQVIKELLSSIDMPPYELTENKLVESKMSDDDSTEVLSARSSVTPSEEDDDRTIVTTSSDKKVKEKSGFKKYWILMPVAVVLGSFIGYTAYSVFFSTGSFLDPLIGIVMPPAQKDTVVIAGGISGDDVANNSVTPTPQDTTQADTQQPIEQPPVSNTSQSNTQANTQPTSNVNPSSANDAANVQKEKYLADCNAYISSAEKKINDGDYKGAERDLLLARNIESKLRDQVLYNRIQTLLDDSKEKIEEEERLKRLDKYNILHTRPIGDNYVVAQDKVSGLFGAVHRVTGEERISFKYVTADRLAGKEEFVRADDMNMVDVYDDNGLNSTTKERSK